jgi:hypothetical protein
MKKIATLFCCIHLATLAFSQSPFTITKDNFPIYGFQQYNGPNASNGNNLVPAANGNWDLSSYHGSNTAVNDYQIETLPFYTNEGIDVFISNFKALTPTLSYMLDNEFDFNNSGVYDKGFYVNPQAYPLSSFTGNSLDSLTFPLQGANIPEGIQVMKFPATYQSGWKSQSRRVINFNLTVMAAGLNKTPSKHVYTVFRADTVLGWGKLRVYANGAPSIPYEVLINRTIQTMVDSFFVGGLPAPAALLTAFGVSQGQVLNPNYRYSAYREGNSTPLAILRYSNSNFTTSNGFFFDINNLSTTPTHTPSQVDYSTLLFPNPCSNGQLTLQVSGNVPGLTNYEILDMEGRLVQSGQTNLDTGLLQLSLDAALTNGTYLLRVLDDPKQTAITETFMLMR